MNTLLRNKTEQQMIGTSALGPMRHPATYHVKPVVVISSSRSTTSRPSRDSDFLTNFERTTSGVTLPSGCSTEATRKALNELRRLSGLTWDQLARLFNVSRRSLHFWASGQPLSRANEEILNRLLGTVKYINRGSASLNRSLLLSTSDRGIPLLDLLIESRHEEVKQILGPGNAPIRPELGPLSEKERKLRMPPKPEDLIDTLHDNIHRDVGRSKSVKVVRSRKDSSGQ